MTNNKEIDNYDLFGLKDEKNKLFYLNIKNLIDSYYKKINKDIDFDIYKSINDENEKNKILNLYYCEKIKIDKNF